MKIRKLFFITIVTVGLCLSILQISFADYSFSASIDKPISSINEVDGYLVPDLYYIAVDRNTNTCYICRSYGLYYPQGTNFYFKTALTNDVYTPYVYADKSKISGHVGWYECYDLDGNLLYQSNSLYQVSFDGKRGIDFRKGQNDQIRSNACDGYPLFDFNDDGDIYKPLDLEPFVHWNDDAPPLNDPEFHSYTSSLSEPVADKYNSYAVLDDHLIWISYRINGIYTRSASIENISEIYSYNAQITESGTGTYAGQQNGYTENIVIPSQSYSGSTSGNVEEFSGGGDVYGNTYDTAIPQDSFIGVYTYDFENINFSGNHSGIISGTSLGNIDFSGVNTGNVHFNSNGTVSLNDIEYYPVSFNHNDIFEYFRLYCLPTDADNFVFWLAPDRSFVPLASTNQLLVNMDFYYSEFDLEGNYIRSEFHTVTETDIGLFDAYQTEERINSVKFYGIDFFNIDNLSFNLSSVLWQYDYEFKQWRDNMYSKLSDIHNVLSQSESLSSYQGKEFGSQLNANNAMDDLSYNSNSVNSNINSLLGESINKLGSDGGILRSLTANIIALGNGKIFSLLIISLAAGVIILLLGKNKND